MALPTSRRREKSRGTPAHPDLDFDPVGKGQCADEEIHQCPAVKDIPEQEGEGQQQKSDGQGVQNDQQGLGLEPCQHRPQGVWLAPQGQ